MQPTHPFSKTVPYTFRTSTCEQEPIHSAPASPRYRRELSPNRTPTLTRSPMHDCQQIDPENTKVKIIQRVWSTYFRMQVASVFSCHTWRGTTRFNGSVAHCDCQAAHSSLVPTLYDDKLRRVTSSIVEDGFDALSPISEKYICHRFDLDTPQKEILSCAESPGRPLQQLFQHLSLRQKNGSFVDTEMEKARNATFQNPPGSNQLDSHLEHYLRRLEDELAEACKEQKKSPILCTQELVVKHIDLLEEAIRSCTTRLAEFDQFIQTHMELNGIKETIASLEPDTITQEHCQEFIEKAGLYISLRDKLMKHLSGAPHLNDFLNFFLAKTPFHTLRGISKDFRNVSQADFLIKLVKVLPLIQLTPFVKDVSAKRRDIQNRLEEAQIQLEEIRNVQVSIPSFDWLFFGVVDGDGNRRNPTKDEIADALIEETHTIARKTQKKLSYSEDSTENL